MITTTRAGAVAAVLFDRAERRNALTPEMLGGFVDALEEAGSTARAVVVGGVGKVFCAGFDLSLCRDDAEGGVMKELLTGLSRAILAMRRVPVPIVVAAQGAAIAGGCALLGGADVVITNDEATLGYPVTRLGISPGVSAPFLRLGVGDAACRERMLDSTLISGREALRIGLAHESTATAEDVMARAMARGEALAGKPPGAVAATKAWLNEVTDPGSSAEAALVVSLGLAGGREERERLAAFWAGSGRG